MSGEGLTELPDGSLRRPQGMTYRRTPERVRPRAGRLLIAAGAAVVTNVYPEGLVWYEGQAAQAVWAEIAPRLLTGRPPHVRDLQCVGHIWESDSGAMLLRFDGEH